MATGVLPSPTTDLDAARRDLAEHGYALVTDALDATDLARVRDRLVEQAAAEAERGVGFFDTEGANQRVFTLINKGEVFRDLVLRPFTREMMEYLLGPDCLLSSLTANIAGPGGHEMPLHSDQGYVPRPHPYPVVANIMWMLDDFNEANGATRVVPGSHVIDDADELAQLAAAAVSAEGPAGTALVFDGRILHGTGANRTDAARHGILSYHCRPFMRTQENHFLGLDEDVVREAPDELLSVLGYRIWARLGRVDHPTEGAMVRPGEDIVGELRPSA